MTAASTQPKPEGTSSAGRPVMADFARYWLGAYALVAVAASAGMLLGAGAMVVGGVGTPSGDVLFGVGAFIGCLVGLVPGFLAMMWITPREPAGLQSLRHGELGAGSFYFAIVQLGAGIGIMNGLQSLGLLPKFFTWLPGNILGVAMTGGIPSSLGATLFMVYMDRKRGTDKG